MPSSRSVKYTWAGEQSTKRSERSTASTASTSSSLSLFGGAGRGLRSASPARVRLPVVGGPGAADGGTGGPRAEQRLDLGEALVDHGLGSSRAAGRLLGALGQQPRQELRCFSLDLEGLCGAWRAGPRGARSSSSGARSRARPPSASCGAWGPSPRGRRPRGPGATRRCGSSRGPRGAAALPSPRARSICSYSSRMASLYSTLNRRRVGFAAGSSSGTPPSWARASRAAVSWSFVYVVLSRPGGMVGYSRCLTSA